MKHEDLKLFPHWRTDAPVQILLAGISYPDPAYRVVRPRAECWVIEYVLDGVGHVTCNGVSQSVTKDMVYFLPQGSKQEYFSDSAQPYTKIFMNVTGSLCTQLTALYGLTGKYFFHEPSLKPLFQRIPELMRSTLPDAHIQSALQGLFVEILSRLSHFQTETVHSPEALQLRAYLDNFSEQNVSAQALSRVIFRSPDYCLKLFRREFGITPYAYQLERKMQTAKVLLTETNMSVGAIAESLGYSDLHYFSNLFLKKCGCRPLAYRKKKREIPR